MNESAAALAFGPMRKHDVCRVFGVGRSVDSPDPQGEVVLYATAEECRRHLKNEPVSTSVIVANKAVDVAGINLAAALAADIRERDVYLLEEHPSRALLLNARSSGVRGVIDFSQAERLLAPRKGSSEIRKLLPPIAASTSRDVSSDDGDVSTEPVLPPLVLRPDRVKTTPSSSESPTVSDSSVLPALPSASSVPPKTVGDSVLPEIQIIGRSEEMGAGRVVGFFSGRGGVGKSAVSLMTALAARKRGLKVAIIDLDLQFGDIGFLAGSEPSGRLQKLELSRVCECRDFPVFPDDVLAVISAPVLPEQGERYAPFVARVIREAAKQRDMVIINTGSFWTDVHAESIRCCTHIALVMDQRATSIEACKQVIGLCNRLNVPQASFLHLLNGCGRGAAFTPQDVCLALGGFEVIGIADGGLLVDELLSLGCPMELLGSENAFVSSLESVLDEIVGPLDVSFGSAPPVRSERARVFDLDALCRFFEGGGRRVAT